MKRDFVIYKHIGNLSEENNGWVKELNFISWENREPVYDIRTWTDGHKKYGKGVTLTAKQIEALKTLINSLIDA